MSLSERSEGPGAVTMSGVFLGSSLCMRAGSEGSWRVVHFKNQRNTPT